MGIYSPNYNLKFDKVTIGVRDETFGVTHFAMTEEHYLDSRKYLEDKIAMMLGGRAAEELIFGKMNVTGGAYNDIQ
ncbi:cell division protein FtsH, partial [Staphylococcus aureus]|nr:cell division protein FtsH [Staphylococcus aureus]